MSLVKHNDSASFIMKERNVSKNSNTNLTTRESQNLNECNSYSQPPICNKNSVKDRLCQKLKNISRNYISKRIGTITKLADLSNVSASNNGVLRKPASRSRFQKLKVYKYSNTTSNDPSFDLDCSKENKTDMQSTMKLYSGKKTNQKEFDSKRNSLKQTKKRHESSVYYKRLIRV